MTAVLGDDRLPPNFWSKVDAGDNGCWLWTAARKADGYGVFAIERAAKRAHRVSYEALVGPIPSGLQLDHLCRTRHCVNPDHLEPVSQHENNRRGESRSSLRARQTECVNGHPFDDQNTAWVQQGKYRLRRCKACAATRARRYARSKAAS